MWSPQDGMCRRSTNVFRWYKDLEPQKFKSGKCHLSGGLLTHSLARLFWKCGKQGTESWCMIGHGGFRLLEENYVGGASMECVFSAGVTGIPSDKTWALFSYWGKESWGRVDVWMWRRVKLYCPDIFIHATTTERVERAIIFGKKPCKIFEHTCI